MLSIYKSQSYDYYLIASSYHESSHTIVGLNNLILINNTSIITELGGGKTIYTLYNIDSHNDEGIKKILLLAEIGFLYAGLQGERIYYEDICGSTKLPMHLKEGSSEDTASAANLIKKSNLTEPGLKTSAFKKKVQQEAREFLIEHWDDVKLISHSLYKKKNLCSDELKHILTRHSPNKDFWKEKFKKIKLLHENENLNIEIVKTLTSPKI